MTPAATQLLELLAAEIAAELLHPNETPPIPAKEKRGREIKRCETYSPSPTES